MAAGKEIRTIRFPWENPTCMALAADGQTLAVGSSDGAIRFWSLVTGAEVIKNPAPQDQVNALAFSRDGRLLVTVARGRTVCLREAKTGRELWTRMVEES